MATKKRDKKISLKEHYSLSWQYIKECKNYILFILVIFLWSAVLAFVYQPPELVDIISQFLQDLLKKTEGLNMWQMILFIFDNNLRSSFFSMLAGVLFGIFPVIVTFSNGYVLGYVVKEVVMIEGLSSLWRLLPHGIFEFPALILSLALGTKLGAFIFAGNGKIKKEFVRRTKQSIGVFLFIILPLLIVAAIIEGILIVVLS